MRPELRDTVIGHKKNEDGTYNITLVTTKQWPEGKAAYGRAFANSYKRVGANLGSLSSEEGAAKFVAIPLYLIYVTLYTLIGIYPVLQTLEEAEKLKVSLS